MAHAPGRWALLTACVAVAVVVTAAGSVAVADEPGAQVVLTVEAIQPQVQADRLLALFQGSRAPHPAAALAAWKHATPGQKHLSKPLEAAIAALNPAMARELRAFDRGVLRIAVDPRNGRLQTLGRVPGDDGTLAALATALALTDGAPLDPLDRVPVFRLGPPGSVVAASSDGVFAVAPDRAQLAGLLAARPAPALADATGSGWSFQLDPDPLRNQPSLTYRRIGAALAALGCHKVEGHVALDGETVSVHARSHLDPAPAGSVPIDPSWLDAIPAANLLAVASLSLGRNGAGLATAFTVADRVEKADPARAQVAPLRLRLNLLAAAAGVRPDVDFWPHLRGITIAVLVDNRGQPALGLVGLHTENPATAERITRDVLPRLATTYLRAARHAPPADGPVPLGSVGGRSVQGVAIGSTAWVGWGDGAIDAARDAAAHAGRSAAPTLRTLMSTDLPQRLAAVWPGRWERVAAASPALARAIAPAPPIVWAGRLQGHSFTDEIHCDGLRGIIHRWLDALPLDPPTDRSTPAR